MLQQQEKQQQQQQHPQPHAQHQQEENAHKPTSPLKDAGGASPHIRSNASEVLRRLDFVSITLSKGIQGRSATEEAIRGQDTTRGHEAKQSERGSSSGGNGEVLSSSLSLSRLWVARAQKLTTPILPTPAKQPTRPIEIAQAEVRAVHGIAQVVSSMPSTSLLQLPQDAPAHTAQPRSVATIKVELTAKDSNLGNFLATTPIAFTHTLAPAPARARGAIDAANEAPAPAGQNVGVRTGQFVAPQRSLRSYSSCIIVCKYNYIFTYSVLNAFMCIVCGI